MADTNDIHSVKPPVSSSRTRSQEKRAAILDSAMNEFLEHGYSAASMDRISEGAGVSKATVYSHFNDKQTLFIALIETRFERECVVDLDLLPAPGTVSRAEHIHALVEALLVPLDSPNSEYMIRFLRMMLAESGRFPELARTFALRIEKPALNAIAQYIRMCEIVPADADAVSWILAGTLVYHTIINHMIDAGDIMPMPRDRLLLVLCAILESAALPDRR